MDLRRSARPARMGAWSTRLRKPGSAMRPTTKRRGRRIRRKRCAGSSTSSGWRPAAGSATSRRAPGSSPACWHRIGADLIAVEPVAGMRAQFRHAAARRSAARRNRRGGPVRGRRLRRGARRAGVALVRPRPGRRRDAADRARHRRRRAGMERARPRRSVGRRDLGDHGPGREAGAVARPRQLARHRHAALPGFGPPRTAEFRHVQPLSPRAGRATDRVGEPRCRAPRSANGRASSTKCAPCSTTTTRTREREHGRAPVPRRLHRVRPRDDRTRRSPSAAASSCRSAARRSCARCEGPPGAPTLLLLHGWIASGGLNWFRVFEPLARALPRRRPRPARPRARLADPPHLPARRLRRRHRRDTRRARHRPGDRRRVLDGRTRRAAALAPAPRPRRPAWCCARPHPASCPIVPRAPRVPVVDARLGERGPRRGAGPAAAGGADAPAPAPDGCRRGWPRRCGATTGA